MSEWQNLTVLLCYCDKTGRSGVSLWNREQNKGNITRHTDADWRHITLPIIILPMWLLWHRRAAIFLYWSGHTLHFLTCQHGQAKHRAFWHWHFTSLSHTDNSNRRQAWHGDISSADLCAVLVLWKWDWIFHPYNMVKKNIVIIIIMISSSHSCISFSHTSSLSLYKWPSIHPFITA